MFGRGTGKNIVEKHNSNKFDTTLNIDDNQFNTTIDDMVDTLEATEGGNLGDIREEIHLMLI